MTTNYHMPLPTGEAANAAKINAPLSQLDAAVGGAREAAQAALETAWLTGSAVTQANGAASAGQKNVTVDTTAIFAPGCVAQYQLVGGVIETNWVATVNSATQITLLNNIGAGGIADNALLAALPEGLYNMRVGTHNVMDYGAVGDGVHDDTAAIQAAIAAAAATVGRKGAVLLPARTFKITGTLTINTNSVRLLGGGGMFGTTLVCATAAPAIQITGYQNALERIYINCDNTGTVGVVLDDANECELIDVLIINPTDCGVWLKGAGGICAAIALDRVWVNGPLGARFERCSNVWITRSNIYGPTALQITGSVSDIFISQSWFEAFETFISLTHSAYAITVDTLHVEHCRFQTVAGASGNTARLVRSTTTTNSYAGIVRDLQISQCNLSLNYAAVFVELDWGTNNGGGSSRFWATLRDCHVTGAANTLGWVQSSVVDTYYEYVRILIDNPTYAGSPLPLQYGSTRAVAATPRQSSGSAAPVAGPWLRGDIVWNNDPAAAEYVGWICVSAGSPGTWKGFGAIQA